MTDRDEAPAGAELKILYEDEALLAVDKPSGMLVHRGMGRDRVTLCDLVAGRSSGPAHPVHRLDRGTSGVLIFAKSSSVARLLADQLQGDEVTKKYVAIVRGRPPKSGDIDHPVPSREGGPRVPARSTFRTLETLATEPRHSSIVEVTPLTGRFHQVRRHLKSLSHPVIGDANYGRGDLNRAFRWRYGLGRLALHALRYELWHPETGQRLVFFAPLPADLAGPMKRMGTKWDPELFDGRRREPLLNKG